MNKQPFQFTKTHKYLLVLLLALTSIYGIVAMPKNDSSDVSVTAADGTLDNWGDCGENQNACKAGLTCVELKEGTFRCSNLKRWYPCDMNDKVCSDGTQCIKGTSADGNINYICSAQDKNDVCTEDTDCNEGFTCFNIDGIYLARCIPTDVEERDNWLHCDDEVVCSSTSDCVDYTTAPGANSLPIKVCSETKNGNVCDKTDLTCSDGSTCIDYAKNATVTEYYCSNKEEGNVCNDATDCNDGMECGFTETSPGLRRCQVVVETQAKCLNGELYDGTSIEGNEGDTVCGVDQFYTCSDSTWEGIGNEFEGKECKDGEFTDIETAVDCGPLDVNDSEKVDLGDFDNLVRKWGDSCVVSQ